MWIVLVMSYIDNCKQKNDKYGKEGWIRKQEKTKWEVRGFLRTLTICNNGVKSHIINFENFGD